MITLIQYRYHFVHGSLASDDRIRIILLISFSVPDTSDQRTSEKWLSDFCRCVKRIDGN